MNVLHIIHSLNPKAGGPVEFIRHCSLTMMEEGHRVEALSCDSPDCDFLKKSDVPSHGLGPAFLKFGYSPRFVPWLREHAPSYDAVVLHGNWQFTGLGTRSALRGSQTPYFVYPHGMLDPWFNKAYPLKHLKKIPYWKLIESKVLRDARAVLYTCEEEMLLARQSFSNYRANDIVVNYGTRDPQCHKPVQQSAFLKQFPQLAGKRYLLFLSRIQEKKGCDLLLEAFAVVAAKDPQLLLVMAGPDQTGWRATLEALAKRLGIDSRVIWTGMISGDAKWGAILGADVFVLPSHQENFGIAAVEALACGIPVLISNKVNIWREIHADGAGLVAEDNLQGVTQLLVDWFNTDQAQRDKMSKLARSCFLRRFEIRQAAKTMVDAIRSCGVGKRVDSPEIGKAAHVPS